VWEDDVSRTIRFTNSRNDGFMSKFDGTWHVQPFTQETLDSIYRPQAAAGRQQQQSKSNNWLGSEWQLLCATDFTWACVCSWRGGYGHVCVAWRGGWLLPAMSQCCQQPWLRDVSLSVRLLSLLLLHFTSLCHLASGILHRGGSSDSSSSSSNPSSALVTLNQALAPRVRPPGEGVQGACLLQLWSACS
jgi:hypothetical protein